VPKIHSPMTRIVKVDGDAFHRDAARHRVTGTVRAGVSQRRRVVITWQPYERFLPAAARPAPRWVHAA